MTTDPRPPDPSPAELRDLELLRDAAALRVLASEERLAILRELRDAPRSSAEIARRLGLPPQRVHYHVKKLEEAGLVRFSHAGRKRWKEERFFIAVARQFLVDPSLTSDDEQTRRAILAELEVLFREARRRDALGLDLAALARRVVADALHLEEGETLLVLTGPFTRELVDHVFVEAEARGAVAVQHVWGRGYVLGRLDRFEERELAAQRFLPEALMRNVDAVLQITSTLPQGEPPNEEQRAKLPHLMRAVSAWQRELRERGTRFLELSMPWRGDFAAGEASPEEAMDIYWRSLAADPADIGARAHALDEALGEARHLEIVDADGGRLELDVLPEPRLVADGVVSRVRADAGDSFASLPAGSVARMPEEGSGTGTLRCTYTAAGGRTLPDVRLTLEAGRIVGLEGPAGIESLRERLAIEAGEPDVLATIGVGVNPCGHKWTGKTSLDGVRAGVVTLSFGSNDVYGGTRSATLDLRFPLVGVTLLAEGRPVVEGGELRL